MNSKITIAIDADDAAFGLKKVIYNHLRNQGYAIQDLDYVSKKENAMYPEIGFNLAKKIQAGEFDRGILICGTGLGMAMIANKVKGVYAGVCHDVFSAERLMKSNNANIITVGERVIGPELAKVVVDAYLKSEFQGGRSICKVDQMKALEHQEFEHLEFERE